VAGLPGRKSCLSRHRPAGPSVSAGSLVADRGRPARTRHPERPPGRKGQRAPRTASRLPRSWLWLLGAPPLALVAGRLLSPRPPGLEGSLELGSQFLLVEFAMVLPILLPAARLLLRRQKAPSPHPLPEP
jgi:hypothetical protein